MEANEQQPCVRRREALKVIGGATCAIAAIASGCTFSELYGDFAGEAVEVDLELPENEGLKDVGGMIALDVGPVRLNLIRVSETEIIAIDRICPHLGEDMAPLGSFDNAKGVFTNDLLVCTAHGSQFSVTGEPVGGPANSSLQVFPVELNETTAVVYVGVAPPTGEEA